MDKSKIRNQKGAAVTGLVLALFMFIMLMGFFTFDSSRIQMAQRELTATCDAASLAGTAMLTSYQIDNDNAGNTKLINAQTNATMYAANMFRAGNLLGQPLTSATTVATYAATLATGTPGTTKFMVALADPLNNYAPVAPTSPACLNGRAVMVYAGYTYQPVFLSIVGVGTVGLNAMSGGGLPQVDAVLVFDYSGSMDDATMVTFVRTVWDPSKNNTSGQRDYYPTAADPTGTVGTLNKGVVNYIEIPPPTTASDSHRLSKYLDFNYANNPNGSSLNVLPPMRMELSDNNDSMATPHYIMDYNLQINTLPYTSIAINSGSLNANWRRTYYNPPGNCTLAAPGGYGKVWSAAFQIDGQNNANRRAAYDPNTCPLTQLNPRVGGASATVNERPINAYVAHDITNVVSNRCYTDIVVNIGNPGSWPYTQPLNGPNTFVDTGNFTFPTEEPDSTIRGQQFRFENIGVLVAASRGNLDNTNYFNSATGGASYPSVYTAYGSGSVATSMTTAHCKVGYQRAYTRLAMLYSQPIATALDGADGGFFQKISALTDCRFGFVGFSNSSDMASPPAINAGTYGSHHDTTDGSRENSCYISPRFISRGIIHLYLGGAVTAENNTNLAALGGTGSGFRQPRRRLAKADTAVQSVGAVAGCRSNTAMTKANASGAVCAAWSATTSQANGLDNGRPLDNTDTYEAMSTARRMFKNGSNYNLAGVTDNRPAAKHAIVFFSDGVPTGGTSSSEATGAISEATSCKTDGIAIYSIGLDVTSNPSLQGAQITFMGNSGGLADKGGNGGRFFQCTDASAVKDAFAAVARRLSQGQR